MTTEDGYPTAENYRDLIQKKEEWVKEVLAEWDEHLKEHHGDNDQVVCSLAFNILTHEDHDSHGLAELFAVAVGMLAKERKLKNDLSL